MIDYILGFILGFISFPLTIIIIMTINIRKQTKKEFPDNTTLSKTKIDDWIN